MRPAGDEEVNGAAAALLGLHSSASPRPPPTPPAPSIPVPVPKRTFNPWNSGTFLLPTAPPTPPARPERTRVERAIFPGHACAFPYYPGHGIHHRYFDVPVRAAHLGYSEPGVPSNFVGSSGGWVPPQLTPDPHTLVAFSGPREEPWSYQPAAVVPQSTSQAPPLSLSQQIPQPAPQQPPSHPPPRQLTQTKASEVAPHVVETCASKLVASSSTFSPEEPPKVDTNEQEQPSHEQQQREKLQHKEGHQQPIEKQQSEENLEQEKSLQQEQQQRRQNQEKLSINNLWSLIPGTIPQQNTSANNGVNLAKVESSSAIGRERSFDLGYATAMSTKSSTLLTIDTAGRWYPTDIHPPLTDRARRHRARALARLRARRRALAAAQACSADRRPSVLKRNVSECTTDVDSNDGSGEHDSAAGAVAAAHNSGREVDGNPALRKESHTAGSLVVDHSCGVSTTTTAGCDGGVAREGGGGVSKAITSSNTSTSSKVGDLFELMRNVSANAAAAALAAEGGLRPDGDVSEGRELGRPVKYKYRQEAARSRKRTRGRFVSEKAPAFVSITELMALRRAERERQQQKDSTPVFVGAG